MAATWQAVHPILPARDVPAAQRWYRDVLGLEIGWLWNEDFGAVGRDAVELFLYASAEDEPGWCSLFVDDVDAVYAAVRANGGDIADELEEKPWNVREFTVRDPTGNRLRVGEAVEDPVTPPELRFPERGAV